jgi:hypothetical protein
VRPSEAVTPSYARNHFRIAKGDNDSCALGVVYRARDTLLERTFARYQTAATAAKRYCSPVTLAPRFQQSCPAMARRL